MLLEDADTELLKSSESSTDIVQNGGAHAVMLEDDVFVKHLSTVAHFSTVSSSQTYYDVIASYTTSSLF